MSENSFRFEIDPRREVFVRLVGDVQAELARAVEAAGSSGLSKADIARRLGVDRSVITRRLSGRANLTLKVLADLAWALGLQPEVRLRDRGMSAGSNRPRFVQPGEVFATDGQSRVIEAKVSGFAERSRVTVRANP